MGELLFKGVGARDAVMAAGKRFGRYKGESGSRTSGFVHEETEGFRAIMEAWMQIVNFPSMGQLFHDISNPTYYAREALKGRSYSPQDVTRFSIALGAFASEEAFPAAGRFLTVLANEGEDEAYLISTKGIGREIGLLGFENRKIIEVDGDAGGWLGHRMGGGVLILRGSCGDCAGREMSGGLLRIVGNAMRCCGETMRGGSIIVEGDVEHFLGTYMLDGSIEVKGSAGKSAGSGMKKGSIVIRGDAGDYIGSEEPFRGGGSIQNPVFGWMNPMLDIGLLRKDGTMTRMGSREDMWDRHMKGGELVVHGNAGEMVGDGIKGGVIRIEGDYKSLGSGIKGKVYHKGKLIAGAE